MTLAMRALISSLAGPSYRQRRVGRAGADVLLKKPRRPIYFEKRAFHIITQQAIMPPRRHSLTGRYRAESMAEPCLLPATPAQPA